MDRSGATHGADGGGSSPAAAFPPGPLASAWRRNASMAKNASNERFSNVDEMPAARCWRKTSSSKGLISSSNAAAELPGP